MNIEERHICGPECEDVLAIEMNLWADDMVWGWDIKSEYAPAWCKGANNRYHLADILYESGKWTLKEGKWDHRFYWYPVFFNIETYTKNKRLRNKYSVDSFGRVHWNKGKWRDEAKKRDRNRRRNRKEKYQHWAGSDNDSGSFLLQAHR